MFCTRTAILVAMSLTCFISLKTLRLHGLRPCWCPCPPLIKQGGDPRSLTIIYFVRGRVYASGYVSFLMVYAHYDL